MKVLSLNTQKGYHPDLPAFLRRTLASGEYDFLLLQEVTDPVASHLADESYAVLREGAQLAICYRKAFTHNGAVSRTFERRHTAAYPHPPAYGVVLGSFNAGGLKVQLASLHLHSGMRPGTRLEELRELKRHLAEARDPGSMLVYAGDFNFGILGEIRRAERVLGPESRLCTRRLGATLDSRLSEPHPNLTNVAAGALARFGLGVKLRTDHFFVDAATFGAGSYRIRILPDIVSDHLPIEITWE